MKDKGQKLYEKILPNFETIFQKQGKVLGNIAVARLFLTDLTNIARGDQQETLLQALSHTLNQIYWAIRGTQ